MSAFTDQAEDNPWVEINQTSMIPTDEVPKQAVASTKPQPKVTTHPRNTLTQTRKVSYIEGSVKDLMFGTCIVNFHHLRGPEVEYSLFEDSVQNVDVIQSWPNLPFQALPDGAHSYEETFCYFTLKYNNTTLFAISCSRQIKADQLLEKDDDVTRSSVQKAIVLILRQPIFGKIKAKLSIVTNAFFAQKNFNDTKIVETLFRNLQNIYNENLNYLEEMDFYSDLSIGDIFLNFKKNTLVILKAMLLEKKLAFYSSNPTKLCQFEISFISLIPNLINNLLDCSSPELNTYYEKLKPSNAFQTSDRNSVLSFAGLPLQIFGKGGVFQPYLPLQQFDDLKSMKHYTVGTSNALLLNNKVKMGIDILVNIDAGMIDILSQDLMQPLNLTSYDKKWISQLVTASTNYNSSNSHNTGYIGSDDYIRLQFEDYLIGLVATVKFSKLVNKSQRGNLPVEQFQPYKDYDTNQLKHFNSTFIAQWEKTLNYELFNEKTDDHIFDVFEPRHIYSEQSHDLKASLTEKFQMFKFNENKRPPADDSRKHKNDKENLKLRVDVHNVGDRTKKPNSPSSKIWGWYNKNIKDK